MANLNPSNTSEADGVLQLDGTTEKPVDPPPRAAQVL